MQDPQAVTSAEPSRARRPMPTPAERQAYTFKHVLSCVRYVQKHGNSGPMSTGESIAGAIGAGNMKVLKDMGYTLPEALRRVGSEWVAVLMSDAFIREIES